MKQLTAEQITSNWDNLLDVIKSFPSPRKEQLLELYGKLEERIMFAPASGIEHFHNAHPGGYVEHVLHVVDCAKRVMEIWAQDGATIDYTEEELIFVALNHDLGKIGDMTDDYYVPNESEWHRKNQGKIYQHNPKLSHMKVPDRSIYLLMENGVQMSEKEYMAIKLHDGMYVEENKSYFAPFSKENILRSNLPFVVHQADLMASRIEYEQWVAKYSDKQPSAPAPKQKPTQVPKPTVNATKIFDELFDQE